MKHEVRESLSLKIRWNRKPVSVLICHLSSQPTPREEAGSLLHCLSAGASRYIWSCRPRGRTRRMSPYGVVSSCLTFSPLPFRAVIFCYGFQKIAPISAFRCGVPFPVRTFLCIIYSDRTVPPMSLESDGDFCVIGFASVLTTNRLLRYCLFIT